MQQQTLRRVGHKGADLIAPGNTYASFDAALEAGVDMIEFDVLPARGRTELILAHDYADAARRQPHTLEEGLAYLAAEAFETVELDVDLKLPGYELHVVEALRRHGMLERALLSSQDRSSLRVLRAAEPGVRLGWSVPRLRRDPFSSRGRAAALLPALAAYRAALPAAAARALRRNECDALMVQWRLLSARLVRSVRNAGGQIYVWTVDEPARIRRLQALGVTGVISNDPRLFAQLG